MTAILVDMTAGTGSPGRALAVRLSRRFDAVRGEAARAEAAAQASPRADGGLADEATFRLDPALHIPVEEIARRAAALKAGFVVIDWPVPEGFVARLKRRRVLGALLRRLSCPVVVVRDRTPPVFDAVLAAIDPEPDDPVALDLSRKVLGVSASLAATLGLPLDLVHVWNLPEEHLLQSIWIQERREVIDGMIRSARRNSLNDVNVFLSCHLPAGDHRSLVDLKGAPTHRLAEISSAERSNLLVLGTRGRRGLAGLVPGNRALRLAEAVGQPIVIVSASDVPQGAPGGAA